VSREELVKELMEKDPSFRELKKKHEELDKKIRKLEKHHPMTHDLELEIEKLKKEKLYYKDLIEERLRAYEKERNG